MLLCTQSGIKLLWASKHMSVCASSQYWTAGETGHLPRECKPLTDIHSMSRFPHRLHCLETQTTHHFVTQETANHMFYPSTYSPKKSSFKQTERVPLWTLLQLPSLIIVHPFINSLSPISLLSPLRTHSPEWMLMVVPTRLLFLCLFSHRKSRARRAYACACEEEWVIDDKRAKVNNL